jgi:hypothetical protein
VVGSVSHQYATAVEPAAKVVGAIGETGLNAIPGGSVAYNLTIAATGDNPFTGQTLSTQERAMQAGWGMVGGLGDTNFIMSAPDGAMLGGGARSAIGGLENVLNKGLTNEGDFVDGIIQVQGSGEFQVGGSVVRSGKGVVINDAMLYPYGVPYDVPIGPSKVRSLINDTEKWAIDSGFDSLTINSYRVSGANPGHFWTITRDLTR